MEEKGEGDKAGMKKGGRREGGSGGESEGRKEFCKR